MLGMMNAPSDGVEFYSTNNNVNATISEADRKTFTEAKQKDVITYTKDGRRLINGKPDDVNPGLLWGEALMRGHLKANIKVGENEEDAEVTSEEQPAAETAEQPDAIQVVEQPFVASTKEELEK